MKITKLGHCCLVIEIDNIKILTDPGNLNEYPQNLPKFDAILITHEHEDHLHLSFLEKIIAKDHNAKIYCNKEVAKLLDKERIKYNLIKDNSTFNALSISIEMFESLHSPIYEGLPRVLNTGFLIDKRLYIPGDSLELPNFNIEILALPVAGPWLKLAECIDYAKKVMPKVALPIHDGMLSSLGSTHNIPVLKLEEVGIKFIKIKNNKTILL